MLFLILPLFVIAVAPLDSKSLKSMLSISIVSAFKESPEEIEQKSILPISIRSVFNLFQNVIYVFISEFL